jgi:RNA polymerase sigma-70 factor (ECF subfamily)
MRPSPVNGEDLEGWILAARAGSAEALGRLLEACRPYLLAIAERELPDELRAKCGASDLVQDAFLKVHNHFHRFSGDGREEVLAWLRRVLLNHLANVRDHYRGTQKRHLGREVHLDALPRDAVPSGLADPSPTPRTQAENADSRAALERSLDKLNPRYARVIRLRYMDGCSFPEIAAELNCSAEAARKLWLRAVVKLQALVEAGDDAFADASAE